MVILNIIALKKRILLSLILLNIFNSGFAQERKNSFKGDELYATVNSLRDFDFGFAYKMGLTNNWYLRFDVLNASFNNKTTHNHSIVGPDNILVDITEQKNANYGAGIGIEKRSEFNAHIEFLYGISFVGKYNEQNTKGISADTIMTTLVSQNGWSYGGGVNLGVITKVAKNLHVAGELFPQYLFTKEHVEYTSQPSNTTRKQTGSGSGLDFDLKNIRLSLVYRFRR